MKPTRFSYWLVALGALCPACGAVADAGQDDDTDYLSGPPGGKADNPNAGDNPALANPPPELVQLAPEFFRYQTAFAATRVGVGRSPAGGIFLRASDCETVDRHVDAFLSLRRRVEPGFSGTATLAPAVALADGWCEAKLDRILTPYLAQTFWKGIDDTSVDINCWGHALRTIEAIPSIVAAESSLFSHVLSSQCTPIPATEEPLPGDIVAIRAAEVEAGVAKFQEFHGTVWVTEDLWITKNGGARFDISPPSFVLDVYARVPGKPQCSERTDGDVSLEHIQDCGLVVQAFRCDSLADLRAKHPEGFPLFDSLLPRARGLLDHRVFMQQAWEGVDPVVALGSAYVSRHPFSYVHKYYEEHGVDMTEEVESFLAAANQDTRMRFAYDLTRPALPELPSPLVEELEAKLGSEWTIADGDGFATYCEYHQAEHDAQFAAFEQAEPTLSVGDRGATMSLLQQLASSDCRSWEATLGIEPYLGKK